MTSNTVDTANTVDAANSLINYVDNQLNSPPTTIEEKKSSSTTQPAPSLSTIDDNQVINKWNGMAKWYAGMLNHYMAPTYHSLVPHLQLYSNTNPNDNNPFKLLEVAIGDGFNSINLIKELITAKSTFEYHGIDIAKEMIDLANNKIKNDVLLSLILSQNDNKNKYKINISVKNGEILSDYNDNTFDRYIASLCLNLTGNALNMIKESYRVLKPNGICAFSIWGDRNKSNYFETFGPIYKRINEELGINSNDNFRTNYHLSDNMDATIIMFKSVGFSKVFYFDINVALPFNTSESWSNYYLTSPRWNGLLNQCKDDTQKNKIKQILVDGLNNKFNECVVNSNKAITHNNFCIIAIK